MPAGQTKTLPLTAAHSSRFLPLFRRTTASHEPPTAMEIAVSTAKFLSAISPGAWLRSSARTPIQARPADDFRRPATWCFMYLDFFQYIQRPALHTGVHKP